MIIVVVTSSSIAASQVSTPTLPSYITLIKAWRHGETEANRKNLLAGGGPDDSLEVLALNNEGKKQAEELGKLVVQEGKLDVIYTSDLSRALDTAGGVVNAFKNEGKCIELRLSKQLREILHGQFELTDAKKRNDAGTILFCKILKADDREKIFEKEHDRFRFWKIHPLVSNEEVVSEDIVDVEDYLQRGETKPETPYHLWQRIHQEFLRIAKENPGKIIGVSTHGACLTTLLDGLNPNPKGVYLSPHYNGKEIKIGDEVMIPAAAKVANGALIHFKYDSRNDKLEICDP